MILCVDRLDLTAASVAYLLEPQWNPQMEEQALCRIHRLGQRNEVKTIRYRISNSFEEVRNDLVDLLSRSLFVVIANASVGVQRVVQTQDLKKGIAAEAFSGRTPADGAKKLQVSTFLVSFDVWSIAGVLTLQ